MNATAKLRLQCSTALALCAPNSDAPYPVFYYDLTDYCVAKPF